ncbi:MAG TPA: hypothetical protein ENN29_01345 [Candidatus Hydrogenedentes bacterium]|nr:hypothetical protein [Candidatus Hydrogenedentota bacterium]
MKPSIIIAAAAFLVLAACSEKPSPPAQTTTASTTHATATDLPARQPVLYYFHRTVRCAECLSMELYTGKLVAAEYAAALVYAVVNIDDPGNEHYAADFNLTYSTLVLTEEDTSGNVLRWKDLKDAWLKSHEEKAFRKYVSDEITAWLVGEQ